MHPTYALIEDSLPPISVLCNSNLITQVGIVVCLAINLISPLYKSTEQYPLEQICIPPFPPLPQSTGQSAFKLAFVSSFHSLTSLLTSLNSAMPASPMHSYSQPSDVVTTTPSALSRSSAMLTSSLLQLDTPSAST